ncbi:MAG: ATP-binding protein [Candidatus Woesearchaeota archaeon]
MVVIDPNTVKSVNNTQIQALLNRIEKEKGHEIIDAILDGFPISENDLRNQRLWSTLPNLFDLFDRIMSAYGTQDPDLFFDLGKGISETESGPLYWIAKRTGRIDVLVKNYPWLNRRFNLDQEIETISVTPTSALLLNYFVEPFRPMERLSQCRWTKGIMAGGPKFKSMPSADIREIMCSFSLEEIFRKDYDYLGLQTKAENGVFYIEGEKFAEQVMLEPTPTPGRFLRKGKKLFSSPKIRGLPPGVNSGIDWYFDGNCHLPDGNDDHSHKAFLVTRTLTIGEKDILQRGQIYGAPYCLYDMTWNRQPALSYLLNMVTGKVGGFLRSKRQFEMLLEEADRQLQETERARAAEETARRKFEQLSATLEIKVDKRTAELKQAQARIALADKMSTLGQFAAGMAHDIHNPITALGNQLRLMRLTHSDYTTFIEQTLVSRILDEGDQGRYLELLNRTSTAQKPDNAMERMKLAKQIKTQLTGLYEGPDLTMTANEYVDLGITPEEVEFIISISHKSQEFENCLRQALQIEDSTELDSLSGNVQYLLKLAQRNYITEGDLRSALVTGNSLAQTPNSMAPSIRGIQGIVDNFLLYARHDTSEFGYGDVSEGIDLCLTNLQRRISDKRIKVSINYQDTPNIYGNMLWLNQVWTNILNNALDALPSDGEINIRKYQENDYVVVELANNGPRIPDDVLESIFTPLFTTKSEGIGLGLSTVKLIADQHNGRAEVITTDERTAFQIYLPITTQ